MLQILRNTECEQLQTHVNAYLDNKIDVHFLLDETDKKVELETENSRLGDELSKVIFVNFIYYWIFLLLLSFAIAFFNLLKLIFCFDEKLIVRYDFSNLFFHSVNGSS